MTAWWPSIAFRGWTVCQRDAEFEGQSIEIKWRDRIVQLGFARRETVFDTCIACDRMTPVIDDAQMTTPGGELARVLVCRDCRALHLDLES